ncbi:hypothetical protein M1O54_05805 [Dehalococcoidia bacterium]|nr:hypothetical protein [Dehalococcoidia bacterium]MCL0079732.1 hypothetical protein [Dehalococcoidia bacterium]MCL0089845.1 hypothetical protein [Dehalococcoidia bacterium]
MRQFKIIVEKYPDGYVAYVVYVRRLANESAAGFANGGNVNQNRYLASPTLGWYDECRFDR